MNKHYQHWYRTVYLKSDHWLDLRAAKLEQNPFCELCEGDGPYDVHHKQYRRIYDCTTSDLETLCRKCHNLAHTNDQKPSTGMNVGQWAFERHQAWLKARQGASLAVIGKGKLCIEPKAPKIRY